jgi:outer membrane protein TolC
LNPHRTPTSGQPARKADNSPPARSFALIALGLACLAPATLRAQLSLSTVVDLAQKNSSTVKLADADLSKTIKVLAEAKDVYIPNFILASSIGPPSIGFTFSQPSIASASMQSLAFSFPQRQYIEAAKRGIEAAQLGLKEAKEQSALEASTEYIELDTVSRELQASQQQAEFSDRLLQIEQQRQEAGVDPLSEVLQARLKAAQLKLSRMHLQSRAVALIAQLAALTGLPTASISTLHESVPEIPAVKAEPFGAGIMTPGLEAVQMQARAREFQARGDILGTTMWPQIAFGAQYNRDATSLNNYNTYFSAKKKFKADNFNAGFSIQIPIFDVARRDKARQSVVEALRARVEAEQAQRQNDIQIATLSGSLQELDALAEVASLKQQIASEQLKTVQTELQSGNGAGVDPGAPPQASPKLEQLARIDERQKAMDALDAGLDLSKARLNLLRALGHMEDWLHTLSPAAPAVSPASASNAPLTKPGS